MKKIILVMMVILSGALYSQAKSEPAHTYEDLFYLRSVSARMEATGLTGVTYNNWDNPAADYNESISFKFNYSNNPNYYDDGAYYFFDAGFSPIKNFRVNLAYENLSHDYYLFEFDENKENNTVTKLSVNSKILDNLFFGISGNYYFYKNDSNVTDVNGEELASEVKKTYWTVDFGALYEYTNSDIPNQKLTFAASYQNAIQTDLELEPSKLSYDNELPAILKLGTTWNLFNNDDNWMADYNLKLHYQYRTLTDSSLRDMNSFGLEYTQYDMLTARLGYYIDDEAKDDGQFTYGFGIAIPFNKFDNLKSIPLEIRLDYAHLDINQSEEGFTFEGRENETFDTFGIELRYNL
ncbi:MAG: hypothetical protein JXR48_18980 [Candidatus Delongbacteria bacterium]|nr:hypothetical protein [Candidatus Delongbacteria bacterium]MBN2837045.1 hypothetical protein [Candidatus Delongbacteria bacterium]